MSAPPVDSFKGHLVVLLSIYENGPLSSAQIPCYEGPGDWQTEMILRSLDNMARRMWDMEKKESDDMELTIDELSLSEPQPLAPEICSPLVVPPGPLGAFTPENNMSAVEELRLLKAQVSDVARVCNAVAHGDLTQRITVPVWGTVTTQVKDVVNTMVDRLSHFAGEMSRLLQEVGTTGTLGGRAQVEAEGTWRELTDAHNEMLENFTLHVRVVADIAKAVALGDLGIDIEIPAQGELLDMKCTINAMMSMLRLVVAEVSRVTSEVGNQGILGSRTNPPRVEGDWLQLLHNVNRMCMSVADQVRTMSYLADAVALGDLSQSIRADGQGEMLDLQVKVNRTVQQLNTFVEEIARVAVAAESGDFTSMRVPDVQGKWKVLVESVDSMAVRLADCVGAHREALGGWAAAATSQGETDPSHGR